MLHCHRRRKATRNSKMKLRRRATSPPQSVRQWGDCIGGTGTPATTERLATAPPRVADHSVVRVVLRLLFDSPARTGEWRLPRVERCCAQSDDGEQREGYYVYRGTPQADGVK